MAERRQTQQSNLSAPSSAGERKLVPVVKRGRKDGGRVPTRGGGGKDSSAAKAQNKPTGNAKTQRNQQPLSSKYRWSSKDLTVATREDLCERVAQLQMEVENIRRALNKSSSGKLDATTSSGKPAKHNTKAGKMLSSPHSRSCPRLGKSCESIQSGWKRGSVQSVDRAQRADQAEAALNQPLGGRSKSAPSIATGAEHSRQTGIPHRATKTAKQSEAVPVQGVRPSKEAQVTTPVQETPLAKPRNLPRNKGVSFSSTVKSGPTVASDKPILATVSPAMLSKEKLKSSVKRKLRFDDTRFVDEELVHYLRMEFAFKPRSAETFGLMHTSLRKHLRTFDTSHHTQKEIYDISVEVVNAAVAIPPQEQAVRAGWKNETALEEVRKNNLFVSEGKVGHIGGIFSKTMMKMSPRPK
jgi:hypothetical protein